MRRELPFTPSNLRCSALNKASVQVLNWYGQYSYMRHVRKAEAKGEKVRPEARLDMCFIGAVATPVSLFIFAWTAPYTHVHWIAPCIGE